MALFHCSGEINRRVRDVDAVLREILAVFGAQAVAVTQRDGVSVCFDTWRFNVRASNTEPLLRLNVETRGDTALLADKTQAVLAVIDAVGG